MAPHGTWKAQALTARPAIPGTCPAAAELPHLTVPCTRAAPGQHSFTTSVEGQRVLCDQLGDGHSRLRDLWRGAWRHYSWDTRRCHCLAVESPFLTVRAHPHLLILFFSSSSRVWHMQNKRECLHLSCPGMPLSWE